jgi:hypothetical protein
MTQEEGDLSLPVDIGVGRLAGLPVQSYARPSSRLSSRRRRKEPWLQARVFNRLALVPGAVVSAGELAEAAYVMMADGGPIDGIRLVRIAIHRLRARGLPISTVRGRGYVLLKSDAGVSRVACRGANGSGFAGR